MEDRNEAHRLRLEISLYQRTIDFYRSRNQLHELPELELQKAERQNRLEALQSEATLIVT